MTTYVEGIDRSLRSSDRTSAVLLIGRSPVGCAAGVELGHAAGQLEVDLLEGGAVRGDQFVDGSVGEQAAAADHEEVSGAERHLGDEVARDQYGAALGGEVCEQAA